MGADSAQTLLRRKSRNLPSPRPSPARLQLTSHIRAGEGVAHAAPASPPSAALHLCACLPIRDPVPRHGRSFVGS